MSNLPSTLLNSTLNNAVNASDSLFQLYTDATMHLNILASDLASIYPLVTNSTPTLNSAIPSIIKKIEDNTDLVEAILQTTHNFLGLFLSGNYWSTY